MKPETQLELTQKYPVLKPIYNNSSPPVFSTMLPTKKEPDQAEFDATSRAHSSDYMGNDEGEDFT